LDASVYKRRGKGERFKKIERSLELRKKKVVDH